MPLTPEALGRLLQPYLATAPPEAVIAADWPRIYEQLREYLGLLMRWNARINLTAIHTPEEIVRRHFGESLFAGLHLGVVKGTALAAEVMPGEPGRKPRSDSAALVPGLKSRPTSKTGARFMAPGDMKGVADSSPTLLDFGSGAGFPGLPIQILHPNLHVTLAESRHKKTSFLREVIRTLGLPTEVWAERVEAMPASRLFDTVTLRAVDEMEQAVAAASHRASRRLVILGTTASSYPALQASFHRPQSIPIPETVDGSLLIYRRK